MGHAIDQALEFGVDYFPRIPVQNERVTIEKHTYLVRRVDWDCGDDPHVTVWLEST
jgi:hypothetical protein